MNPNQKVVEMPKAARMKAFMIYPSDWQSSKHVEMMDDHEEIAYIRLLMRASQEPDCGLPDNDYELAALSKMGLKWFKPTRERGKRIAMMDPETNKVKLNELGKPVFITAGDKLRQCFLFRPSSEQSPNGRIYNERLYKEFLRYHSFKTEKREATRRYRDRANKENVMDTGTPTDRTHGSHLPPSTSDVLETEANTKGGPAAATVQREEAAAAPPDLQSLSRAVSDSDFESLAMCCINMGIPAPDQSMAIRILQRFPKIPPDKFPLFNGQKSSGLWLHKNQIDMDLEITRQGQRKPNGSEDPVLRQWARDIDRKAGR